MQYFVAVNSPKCSIGFADNGFAVAERLYYALFVEAGKSARVERKEVLVATQFDQNYIFCRLEYVLEKRRYNPLLLRAITPQSITLVGLCICQILYRY